ncbi:MAG: DUF1592 domain-containing protein [Myxococcota bacterium]
MGVNVSEHGRRAGASSILLLALTGCYVGIGEAPSGDIADSDAIEDEADGSETDGDETDGDGESPLVIDPGPAVLPRLTTGQYRNSLEQILGPGLPVVALEPDTNPYLFYSIGATTTSLSELGTQQYEEAADEITQMIWDDADRRLALVGCEPMVPGDACAQGFIEDFGRRAYRRPLLPDELAVWQEVAAEMAASDAWEGLRLAVAGMLQSPQFLYRFELGEPDPEDPARLRYTSFEMASRLSFLLWNVTPDDTLLDAAQAGELLDAPSVRAHAERMLDDPRASAAIQAFFAQYLDLGRLDEVTRDVESYPMFTQTLPQSMRTEVQLLVDDFVFHRDVDIRGIFGTRNTFVNEELAALYEVDAPGASPTEFVPVELPADGPRAGLLTLGAFLTMNAHETEPSPTLRGKYVRERVMCQTIPAPPEDVDTTLPEDEGEAKTLRERLEQHVTDPLCAGCHSFIDPPGFLFENFDSIGAFRTVEPGGYPIDATGELDGESLANATELGPLLASSPVVGECMVTQLFRHAQGRLELPQEQDILTDLSERFAEDGYRFRELLLTLIVHESYRTLAPQEGA